LAEEVEAADEDQYFDVDMLPPIIHTNRKWSDRKMLDIFLEL